jgi:hypothetical protein
LPKRTARKTAPRRGLAFDQPRTESGVAATLMLSSSVISAGHVNVSCDVVRKQFLSGWKSPKAALRTFDENFRSFG